MALPAAAPLLLFRFDSGFGTIEGKAQFLFEPILTSKRLFNIKESYIQEAVSSQPASFLSSATAFAIEKH